VLIRGGRRVAWLSYPLGVLVTPVQIWTAPYYLEVTLMKYTKYEEARVIGSRALQISMGAPVLLKDIKQSDPIEIAKAELSESVIPITVLRDNS